ncbi:hypothetical protein EDB83DRAFT_2364117, partial [Lactarius deliciosus]
MQSNCQAHHASAARRALGLLGWCLSLLRLQPPKRESCIRMLSKAGMWHARTHRDARTVWIGRTYICWRGFAPDIAQLGGSG